jgi:hypothetical protein
MAAADSSFDEKLAEQFSVSFILPRTIAEEISTDQE